MPMHLTVDVINSPSSSSSEISQHLHCFLQLPVSLAQSLSTFDSSSFSSLYIFRLRHTSTNRVFYIGWDGSTSSTLTASPLLIYLHGSFLRCLNLHLGDELNATVIKRLNNNTENEKDIILSHAVLSPKSYKQGDTAKEQWEKDFNALNITANTLQSSFLNCIRVIYQHLCFPLRLPAGDTIDMVVESIQHVNENSNEKYAIVFPDSQIEILSPPSTSSSSSSLPSPMHARVIALSHSKHFSNVSQSEFLTHAFFPSSFSSVITSSIMINVSRKKQSTSQVIVVPVSVKCHASVPSHKVYLPPSTWHALQLTPFTPVLLEFSHMPKQQTGCIQIRSASCVQGLPSVSDLASTEAIFFNGMHLHDGIVLTQSGSTATTTMNTMLSILNDQKEKKEEKIEDSDLIPMHVYTDSLFQPFKKKPSKVSSSLSSSSKRLILQPFRSSPELFSTRNSNHVSNIDHNNEHESFVRVPNQLVDGYPQREETIRENLLNQITPSLKQLVFNLFKSIHQYQSSSSSSIFVIEGTKGTGRTYLSHVIASLLRSCKNTHMRTISRSNNIISSVNQKLHQLTEMFEDASDEGNGLVILDDFDSLWLGRKNKGDEKDERERETEEEDVITERLIGLLNNVKRKCQHYVHVLMVVQCVDELPRELRIPGLIAHVARIPNMNEMDRSMIFYRGLVDIINEKTNKTLMMDEITERMIAKCSVKLGKQSEGFDLRQTWKCIYHSRVTFETSTSKDDNNVTKHCYKSLKSAIEKMKKWKNNSDETESGLEEEKKKKWKWDDLGGVSSIREQIEEVLELGTALKSKLHYVSTPPIRLPHGILLYGPPGCGKTIVARTAAAECSTKPAVKFIKGSELLGKYVGQSESQVRSIFEEHNGIIIFDEFDALAVNRGNDHGSGVGERVVNTLLACMDGVERKEGQKELFIIATTSRPQVIDRALLRPGRLDIWIRIDMPKTTEDRLDILKKSLRKTGMIEMDGEHEALEELLVEMAQFAVVYTQADLNGIVNEAVRMLGECEHDTDRDLDMDMVKMLREAWKESRPSLSSAQRHEYEMTMARFSGEEVVRRDEVGKRLAMR